MKLDQDALKMIDTIERNVADVAEHSLQGNEDWSEKRFDRYLQDCNEWVRAAIGNSTAYLNQVQIEEIVLECWEDYQRYFEGEQLTITEKRERLPHVADDTPDEVINMIYDIEGDRRGDK